MPSKPFSEIYFFSAAEFFSRFPLLKSSAYVTKYAEVASPFERSKWDLRVIEVLSVITFAGADDVADISPL